MLIPFRSRESATFEPRKCHILKTKIRNRKRYWQQNTAIADAIACSKENSRGLSMVYTRHMNARMLNPVLYGRGLGLGHMILGLARDIKQLGAGWIQ